MGIMVYSLKWVMQDCVHQQYLTYPKGPCADIMFMLCWTPKCLNRDYFKAQVYTILFGYMDPQGFLVASAILISGFSDPRRLRA